MPEEEKEQEIENLFENNEGELPQSGKGNRIPGTPGKELSKRSKAICQVQSSKH